MPRTARGDEDATRRSHASALAQTGVGTFPSDCIWKPAATKMNSPNGYSPRVFSYWPSWLMAPWEHRLKRPCPTSTMRHAADAPADAPVDAPAPPQEATVPLIFAPLPPGEGRAAVATQPAQPSHDNHVPRRNGYSRCSCVAALALLALPANPAPAHLGQPAHGLGASTVEPARRNWNRHVGGEPGTARRRVNRPIGSELTRNVGEMDRHVGK